MANALLELRCVKALFWHRQYRQCIQMSQHLLDLLREQTDQDSVQSIFLSFYQGLAYDELARSMHINSRTVLPAIEEAEKIYLSTLLMTVRLAERHPHEIQHEASKSVHIEARVASSRNSTPSSDEDQEPCQNVADFTRSESFSSFFSTASSSSFEHEFTPVPLRAAARGTSATKFGLAFSKLAPIKPENSMTSDNSPLSLLVKSPKSKLPVSVTQSLLKPVRLGSPPKPYTAHSHSVFNLHAWTAIPQETSARDSIPSSIDKEDSVNGHREHQEDDGDHADSSRPSCIPSMRNDDPPPLTVTTTPPHTPHCKAVTRPKSSPNAIPAHPRPSLDENLTNNLDHLRVQLQTHIANLASLKRNAIQAQLQRQKLLDMALLETSSTTQLQLSYSHSHTPGMNFAPRNPFTPSPFDSSSARISPRRNESSSTSPGVVDGTETGERSKARIPHGRSYWAFTPEHIVQARKRERISAGRERSWTRDRWDPTPYRTLAKVALAEL